jgi:hypothetical protein
MDALLLGFTHQSNLFQVDRSTTGRRSDRKLRLRSRVIRDGVRVSCVLRIGHGTTVEWNKTRKGASRGRLGIFLVYQWQRNFLGFIDVLGQG